MEQDVRSCLPDRVRAIVGLLAASAGGSSIAPLIEEGCRCAAHRTCPLGDACDGIHRAFRSSVTGNA